MYNNNLNYYKSLDGVRAIAALMVMVFHFFSSIEVHSDFMLFLSKASLFGLTGVTLFFVLSGFLITRILLHTKARKGYFKNFYFRRILRIFPLYYLFLILVYYFFYTLFFPVTPELHQQIYYYTYLQNFAITFNWDAVGPLHFWSLAVEEHFYLFWPLIIYFLPKRHLAKVIFTIVCIALLLRVLFLNHGLSVYFFTFTQFDSLAIGSLLAILELKQVFNKHYAHKFMVLFLITFIPTLFLLVYFTGQANYYVLLFKYTLLSVMYFSIIAIVLCLKTNHTIVKVLESRFFSYTGKISYGLYVYHPLVYIVCSKYMHTESFVLDLVFKVGLTYLVSAISFRYFESYFLKLKRYFKYERT